MIYDMLSLVDKRALALITLMLRMRNGPDGEGLFTGLARYSVLKGRIEQAAERAETVEQFWALAGRLLGWGMPPARYDGAVLPLIAPAEDDGDVLRVLATRAEPVIMRARQLAKRERASARGVYAPLPDEVPFDDPFDVFDRIAPPASNSAAEDEDEKADAGADAAPAAGPA